MPDRWMVTIISAKLLKGGDEEAPNRKGIQEISKNMKSNKCLKINGVQAELIKGGGEDLVKKIHEIIFQVWEEERMPVRWKETVILYQQYTKKETKQNVNNYRGIDLIYSGL